MAISSGASTPSRAGGLRYAPFMLDVYLQEYKDYLDTKRLNAMRFNRDAKTFYDTRNGFDPDAGLGAWARRWTHWVNTARFCGAKTFDMSTYFLYAVEKNTVMQRD